MKKKILVVDDHPETLRLISIILERAGYDVSTARSGLSGIEVAREIVPDMVLLDIMMPGMDGVEVCKQLREDSNPTVANMTIVMFSARSMMTDQDEAFAADADGYIVKPTRPNELVILVKKYLETSRKQPDKDQTKIADINDAIVVYSDNPNKGQTTIVTRLVNILSGQKKETICIDTVGDIDPQKIQPTLLFNVAGMEEARSTMEAHASDQIVVHATGQLKLLLPLLTHASVLVLCISEHVESISAAKKAIGMAKSHLGEEAVLKVVQVLPANSVTIPADSVSLLLGHELSAVITHDGDMIDLSSQKTMTEWAKTIIPTI